VKVMRTGGGIPKTVLVLQGCEFVLMSVALYLVFIYAPIEKETGVVQKIFYFHVASAWNAFVAFFVIFVASIFYLASRRGLWDILARGACEIGVMFCTATLVMGSLWAKPAWNIWWTWDARLTTTLVLWFIYVGYLILRSATGESERGARAAAALGIVGFIDVPIVFFSVRWWRTMHTGIIVGRSGGNLAAGMGLALMISVFAFTLLFVHLLVLRTKSIGLGRAVTGLWLSLRR
jgi:heme exporter protein C